MADERTVRSFLESAAPIILESRVLEGKRFEAVTTLAQELGLTRDQLACELRLLEQRGVISSAPWDQLDDGAADAPKGAGPPPSSATPSATAGPAAPAPPARQADADEPGPTIRPQPRRPRSTPRGTARPTATPPPGMPPPPAEVDISTTASAMEALRNRASKIMERRGTLSPMTRRKLEKAGKHAGLSKPEIASVLDNVVAPTTEAGPPVGNEATVTPDQLRPDAPSPSESFRRWITQKLSGYPSSILGMDDESGLVGVGVHRYHLAQVLATHVVRDVATERGVRLERDLDGASCNSTVGGSAQAAADDEKLKEFFEQVAPILSQHRGINAKSRVMMNAVSERLGLSQEELEQALATLQRRAGDPDENDPRQLERRESFRAYLRRAMAQLPNGIITFKTEWRLCQAGEHFHGVAPQWIKSTINEVASEIGARFISKQQAIDHVTELVQTQLAERPIIDNATRARVYTEGTQWGLDPMDVDAIIRERTETLRQRLASERRRSRWVINFVIVGLAVCGAIVFAMFLLRPLNNADPAEEESAKVAQTKPQPKQLPGQPWWSDELRVAQARLRVTRPDLRPILDGFNSPQSSTRGQAYSELIEQFASRLSRRSRQEEVKELLTELYAHEPSDAAARSLSSALLAPCNTLDEGLPEKGQTIETMFWGCRVAVALLKNADTPTLRRSSLVEQLNDATGTTGDPLLDEKALQTVYGKALAQRLYRLLTELAADDPNRVGQLFITIQYLASNNVDAETLDQLEIDFLAAVLPTVEDGWDRYGDAIQRAAASSDPNTVLKLLGIYRRATDNRLRGYLVGLFLDRLGASSGSITEAEMIDGIRESLGVASKERDLRRWNQLAANADDLLNRKHATAANPAVVLQETLELAHATAMACALSRGEAGGIAFDEMQLAGPVRLALPGGPWSSPSTETHKPTYPVTKRTVLQKNIEALTTSSSAGQRGSLLQMIANQTESVEDIDPQSGQALAKYLVRLKTDANEHRQVLSHVARLERWDSLRLGLADQLQGDLGRDTQLEEMFSKLLGEEVDLSDSSDRQLLQRRLLEQALGGLADTPTTEDPRYLVFDDASQALVDLYARQAKLLGMSDETYADARKPSAVVAAMIDHMVAQLNGAKLDTAGQQTLDSLPYRMRAIDFVAESDLQYTAALQQIWLELLAAQLLIQHPDQTESIRTIVRESLVSDSKEDRVFEQLRDVHSHLLRLWMLLRPSFEGMDLEGMEL